MRNIKLISIILIILSSIFLGCTQKQTDIHATRSRSPDTIEQITATATPDTTQITAHAMYKVFVDDYYGFKKVIEINSQKPFVYENLTLNINPGDTVMWVNDVDYKLTIVSEQGLWDKNDTRAILISRDFNYTFTQPGIYSFYIKEDPRIAHQKIVVGTQ